MRVVLVYLQPFCCNSVLKCALQPKIAIKFKKSPLFSRFKVVDVDKSKKPVTSACYDVQQVCTYLQPFSHSKSQQWQNNIFLRGVHLFDALVQEEPPGPGSWNFVTKNYSPCGSPQWEFCDPCTIFIKLKSVTHRQMDKQTNRQTPRWWLRLAKHDMLSCVKMV